MKKILLFIAVLLFLSDTLLAQFRFERNKPVFYVNEKLVVETPKEGLWSVSNKWKDNWPESWNHANPDEVIKSGEWTILKGAINFPEGKLLLRDSYSEVKNGLVKCIRRFEWTGQNDLKNVTLSVRFQVRGETLEALLPGILYYGNKMGAKVNPDIIPVYNGTAGEYAIFEDHRYPMPFAMLENGDQKFTAAIHTTPSAVKGAVLNDQWWSMGVSADETFSELLLLSGPIGYNKQRSVAKALQRKPLEYTDTYITMYPKMVIEKEFYIEYNALEASGTGFQQSVYTSLDLHKPYFTDVFPAFDDIVKGKYSFAQKRWMDSGEVVGFNMYDLSYKKDIVMGWCGQADSPGYALQLLGDMLNDSTVEDKVQRSLDFLTQYPVNADGTFNVQYDLDSKEYKAGDHVSCGQAMYNFAKAIETARKSGKYNTQKWETFLKTVCDRQSRRILDTKWNPYSTAEGFYMAPLIIAHALFGKNEYKLAAEKVAQTFAERHIGVEGIYWGGTLDATCEDKEGSWAAFQGFLELYERTNNNQYLIWAKHAMDVCLTYVVVWDIPLPAGRMADYNFKTRGWTVVSPQNQHIDVYGVLFAPEVYKMGKHLNDDRLKKLSSVMYRSCYQLTDPFGSQGEQLQQTNFAQQGNMSDVHALRGGYSEGWTVFWITAHFLNAAARFVEIGVIP